MFNIQEDNKTIENLLNQIDKKLISLKNNNKIKEELKNYIHQEYLFVFDEWLTDYYILGKEIDKIKTREIEDAAIDFISMLNKL